MVNPILMKEFIQHEIEQLRELLEKYPTGERARWTKNKIAELEKEYQEW